MPAFPGTTRGAACISGTAATAPGSRADSPFGGHAAAGYTRPRAPGRVSMAGTRAFAWIVRGLGRAGAILVLCAWFAWTALTIDFSNEGSPELRYALTGAYVLLGGALLLVRPRRRGLFAALGSSAVVALAYALVRPSNDREWLADVAVTPHGRHRRRSRHRARRAQLPLPQRERLRRALGGPHLRPRASCARSTW